MNNRTEEKLKSIDGMRKAMTEILAQAWERGRKYGRLEAQESSRGGIMDNKKASASELLKSMHRRDFICSECQKDDDECKSTCEYGKALDYAIKALEDSGWIPVKTRELTAEEKEEHPDCTFMWDCPLPDDAQDVLITTCWGDVKICTFCVDFNGSYFDEMDEDDVLAWMPLPEPYTKEDFENGF